MNDDMSFIRERYLKLESLDEIGLERVRIRGLKRTGD